MLTPEEKKIITDAVSLSIREPNSARFRWTKMPNTLEGSGNYCASVDAKSPYPAYNGEQNYIVEAQIRRQDEIGRHGPDRRRQGHIAIVTKMCAKYGLDPRRQLNDGHSRAEIARDALRLRRPFLGAGAGERLHARLVGGELARRAGIDDVAVVEHIGAVGDFEAARTFCSTSSTEMPSRAHLATMRNTSRTISGARPCDGSSSMQQLRVEQQRAGDRQHFLLAAGELPALVGLALGEPREQLDRCAPIVHGPGRSSGTLRFSSTVRLAKMRRPSGT